MPKTHHTHAVNESFNTRVPETQSNLSPDEKDDPERILVQIKWERKKY